MVLWLWARGALRVCVCVYVFVCARAQALALGPLHPSPPPLNEGSGCHHVTLLGALHHLAPSLPCVRASGARVRLYLRCHLLLCVPWVTVSHVSV